MEREAVGTADVGQVRRYRFGDVTTLSSSLVLLVALAAAAFGQGAFFGTVRLFIAALIALALALALAARAVPVADLRRGLVLAGLLLASWALVRAAAAGTLASGAGWALSGAGTAAVVSVSRRLDAASRLTLLGGVLAVGAVVAMTGWLGVALHMRPWGLPSQGLWRAASTLTYANATAALLVPLALVALGRLTAMPRSAPLCLVAVCLLTGAGATLSRAGVAAIAAGLLVLCWVLGARLLARAAAGPAVGAGVALLGLVPSLRAPAAARPVIAAVAVAIGLVLAVLIQRAAGWALVLPIAGAALVAALLVIYRAAQFHGAIRMLTHARFTLASSARSGEAAAALHIIERHPLAGVGPGHATLRWISPGGALNVDRYAHNEYLQVLTDLGIAGAALTAAFMAAAGRLLWRAQAAMPGCALWAGAVAAVTAFLLHSGFDFLWQVPAIPLTVAAIVGLAVHQPPVRRHGPPGEPHNEERSWNAASHQG
jgi:O-antigen ligase/polysaccharide polymerase Wzy-like membrane protein